MLAAAAILSSARLAVALGPHELLVLANAREPESIAIAQAYMQLRHIPPVNLVELDLGDAVQGDYVSLSPEAFTAKIWVPAVAALRQRGIEDHILAWVYSTHFPFRISSSPAVSLQGLTFVRNRMPMPTDISEARYISPLFAGPDKPGGNGFGPQSLDSAKLLLREDMPLPNMTLGYTGTNGNTGAEVRAMLARGVASDGSHPTGTVFFVISDDVRSKAREWQYKPAAEGLRRIGISTVVTNALPQNATSILGILAGTPIVEPATAGHFLPGAMAEHLTSYAAAFEVDHQTKLSRWIAAGATGSAGAVCEPMSYWEKFPNARFFNHYSMGCTLLESFYQSIRSPLQLMIIGEPLAAPWAPPSTLQITGVTNGEELIGPRAIDLQIQAIPGTHYTRFVYLIDGRLAGEGSSFTLKPDGLKSGSHELRAVAYQIGFVRSQIFGLITFRVK